MNAEWSYVVFLPFVASLALALICVPMWTQIAARKGIVDTPRADRWHSRPTAKMGGVAMFVATLIPMLTISGQSYHVPFLCGIAGLFLLGAVDDLKPVSPRSKLVVEVVLAAWVVASGRRFDVTSIPIVDSLLTMVWLVGIVNAFNLIDNMDGLSSGVAVVTGITFSLWGVISGNNALFQYALVLSGVSFGFLVFNFHPARVFMGDCGSLPLGFLCGGLGVMATQSAGVDGLLALAMAALALGFPLFDTLFVTIVRKINGRPISLGGRDHTSHRLVRAGLGERQAVLTLLLLATFSASGSFLGLYRASLTYVALAVVAVLFSMIGLYLARIDVYGNRGVTAEKSVA